MQQLVKFLFVGLFLANYVHCTHAVTSEKKENKYNYRHFGLIISGPSGVGKTTLVEELVKLHPELKISISATTRLKRNGEIDGKSYYFLNRDKFKNLAKKDEFIEYGENYGNYYGSPKRNYVEAIENDCDVIFTLSVSGMLNAIKNKKMDFVTIFVMPISTDELKSRLLTRGTENTEQINKRMNSANKEISQAKKYNYIIYNSDFNYALKNLEAIYLAEKLKRQI